MSKWDKYKISESSQNPSDKWNKYKIPESSQSNSEVVGKSVASGLLGNLDIPQTLLQFGTNPEYGFYGIGRKLFNKFRGTPHEPLTSTNYITNKIQSIPENLASNAVKSGLKQYANVDLTPKPANAEQRVLSHAGEFAGGMSPFGLLNAPKNLFNIAKNVGKNAVMGTAIGGTSGALQEAGVNPLVADIGTSVALPATLATKNNLFNKFSKEHRSAKLDKTVAGALENQIGKENIPKVLENIKNYKSDRNKPLGLKLTTPELGQDVGLSRLYRTQSNSQAIPARYAENDIKMRNALEGLGTTGLEETAKGEAIRTPFFERFNKLKEKRARITRPLYEQLENIQEGLGTPEAINLLKKEIAASSPGNKAPLEKYLKGLSRNELDPVAIKNADRLRHELNNIDKEYKGLNPKALEQLKLPVLQELNQIESSLLPRPIQIENTIQELGDKVNALSKTGEVNAARKYGGIKKAYETDLSKNPIGLKHRQEYKRLSEPIGEIEKSSLLHNFVKENKDISKLEGYVLPSEKIPSSIINADIPNTKLLMQKVSGDKEALSHVKGVYMDELLKRATLSSGNFSYDKANKFLNNKYNKEKIDIVFNKAERKKIDHFLDTLERRAKVESMGKVSGSDTHQKFMIEAEFNKSLDALGTWITRLASGTGITGKIGRSVIGAGKNALNNSYNKKYNSVLENALVDPDVFEKLMKNEHKLKTFSDFYNPVPAAITGINLGNRNKQ